MCRRSSKMKLHTRLASQHVLPVFEGEIHTEVHNRGADHAFAQPSL